MADVAREANVSVTTVSYVLGGRRGAAGSRISDETQQRVHDAVKNTGYRINLPARNLRRRKTDHVLLLIDRLSSPYSQKVATDISGVLDSHGIRLSVMVCPDQVSLSKSLEMASGQVADGAIVINPSRFHAAEVMSEAASHGVPLVAVGGFTPDGFDVIQPQGEDESVRAAADHLVAGGRRRIAFIGHLADQSEPEERLRSLRDQLALHQIDLDPMLIRDGARDRADAYAAALDLFALPDPPDAVFSASDIGGIATLWAALRSGLTIPHDVAVVGCGNIEECLLTVPTLSSAGPAHLDYTSVALQMLDRLAKPDRPPERHVFEPWRFFPRESS